MADEYIDVDDYIYLCWNVSGEDWRTVHAVQNRQLLKLLPEHKLRAIYKTQELWTLLMRWASFDGGETFSAPVEQSKPGLQLRHNVQCRY